MTEGGKKPSLDELDAKIRAAKDHAGLTQRQKLGKDRGNGDQARGLSFAIRLGTELVAALMIGVGIGYFLDRWLETGPWFMIAFFFLGAASGIMNVYRAALGYDSAVGYHPADGEEGDKDESDPNRH